MAPSIRQVAERVLVRQDFGVAEPNIDGMIPRLTTSPGGVHIDVWGERLTSYWTEGVPGFGPIFAGDRRAVTQPMMGVERSVWIGLDAVCGMRFAAPAAEGGDAGSFRSEGLLVRRGSQSVGFQHEVRWLDAAGERLLDEMRTVRIASGPSAGAVIDLDCELACAGDAPVTVGPSDFGPLCLRLSAAMLPEASGQLRNSADEFGPEVIAGRAAAWCAGNGVVEGETAGIAVLDHPDNASHPALWASDNRGLLSPAPFRGRTRVLEPDRPLLLRYRIIVHKGYVEAGWVSARMRDWIRGGP